MIKEVKSKKDCAKLNRCIVKGSIRNNIKEGRA
jgi:hypothetical protein